MTDAEVLKLLEKGPPDGSYAWYHEDDLRQVEVVDGKVSVEMVFSADPYREGLEENLRAIFGAIRGLDIDRTRWGCDTCGFGSAAVVSFFLP